MSQLILTARVTEKDLVAVRTHAREVSEQLGLESIQQTRFATAVSEICRNAVQYAGEGTLTFYVDAATGGPGQCLVAEVADQGPGIPLDFLDQEAPAGRPAMGIAGSKRLVDHLRIDRPAAGGTLVRLEMHFPRGRQFAPGQLTGVVDRLAQRSTHSPAQELDRQNRELLAALQVLRDKQAELERADERKNRFVTTLAHELRSPLATLEMSLELLRRKADMSPEDFARRRDVMARQTGQMTKLVDDLMDVSRVSQGKVRLDKLPLELNTLVTQSVEMTSAAISARSHQVSLQLHDGPLWVSADGPRLTQVMCNLIQNSARYTAPGGAIEVRVRREGGDGVLVVKDNGVGIAADVLPHVFGLFVQGHQHPAVEEGGLGLGLTLVHHLVREHGGTVAAHSGGLNQGSSFSVTLPLLTASPAGLLPQLDVPPAEAVDG